jgi:hypothetical protein
LFLKSVGHKRGIAGGFVVLAAAFTFLVSTAWATFPGANGRISYISGYDLHTVLPSGRDDKTIASPAYDSTWSPNGRWLAFTGFASDATGSDIFAIRAGGSDERRLTYYGNNNFGYGWTNTPSYSPGGGRIVFLSTAYHEHRSITTMRNDGSDWQYPLPYSDRGAGDPVWSPDGEIAYSEGGERNSIWAMNPDGSGNHRLVYLGKAGGYGPISSPTATSSCSSATEPIAALPSDSRMPTEGMSDRRPASLPSRRCSDTGRRVCSRSPIRRTAGGSWCLAMRDPPERSISCGCRFRPAVAK